MQIRIRQPRDAVSQDRPDPADPEHSATPGRTVLAVGLALILVQLAIRGWAAYGGWFYLDDYNLLNDARSAPAGSGYLLNPYNDHLMPGGRLLTSLVEASGSLNWSVAATVLVGLQGLASVAALWMLGTLFGWRWGILAPLGVYLWVSGTIPAFLWWAAAVNQLPTQAAFFFAVGAWVRYLRDPRWTWLLATFLAVALGLSFFEKMALIFPVLAYLLLAYFASGSLRERVRHAVRRYWPALVTAVMVGGAFTGYYLVQVRQPFESNFSDALGLADAMLGTAFASAAAGGPWQWDQTAAPAAYAGPPAGAQHAAWLLIGAVIAVAALRRHHTGRAWALLGGYLVLCFLVLLNSRATKFGATIGLEYRYLTDAFCVLVLCLGLAFLPLRGAIESSTPRTRPLLLVRVPDRVVAGLVALVCLSGAWSTIEYARIWQATNASDAYLHTLAEDLRAAGEVDLADQTVPNEVMDQLAAPNNTLRRMAVLVSDDVHFPPTTSELVVVAPDGHLRRALIGPGVRSRPGPVLDCGWQVDDGVTVPLDGAAFDWEWWIRIGYLASQESPVTVSAGSTEVDTTVSAGPNSLYVKVKGSFDSVRIDGLEPDTTLCVDTIEVGQPGPGGPVG